MDDEMAIGNVIASYDGNNMKKAGHKRPVFSFLL